MNALINCCYFDLLHPAKFPSSPTTTSFSSDDNDNDKCKYVHWVITESLVRINCQHLFLDSTTEMQTLPLPLTLCRQMH